MNTIHLETIINAPIEVCFDLSRSIDLHQFTTRTTGEKAVAGRMTGLIEKDEFVTWEATHFFIKQKLTSKIIEQNRPFSFTDCMVKGAFKSMHHNHSFEKAGDQTKMTDDFKFEAPFGIIGVLFSNVILQKYLTGFLRERNRILKEIAESGDWKKFLSP